MRTDEIIIQLARAARPVQPLPRPSMRLAQWTAAALPLAALGVFVVGPRADIVTSLQEPNYVVLACVTLLTALLSAAGAFTLSVPGAERCALQRSVPLLTGTIWAVVLIVLLSAGGDSLRRILALPIHLACILEIVAFGLLPGWALFTMVRRAAPLQPTWTAGLSALAAVALGALGVQIVCPIDDPAHHLAGHFMPTVVLAMCGTLAGRQSLDWLRRT